MPPDPEDIRRILLQNLRTEQLLGTSYLPVLCKLAPARPASIKPPPATPRTPAPANRPAIAPRPQPPARTPTQRPSPAGGPPPAPAPGSPETGTREQQLRELDKQYVKGCVKCALAQTRKNTVFGQGNAHARLVFVGEAPGFEEDRSGVAFVGRAGELLTRMIAAMGLTRDEVYICNVLKCRPPDNRDPAAGEITACSPYLWQQLQIIDPEVIIALGRPAAQTLLQTNESMSRLRGEFHECHISGRPGAGRTVPLMPTYHPAYLLRYPENKAKTWSDLQQVMKRLNLPLPSGG